MSRRLDENIPTEDGYQSRPIATTKRSLITAVVQVAKKHKQDIA